MNASGSEDPNPAIEAIKQAGIRSTDLSAWSLMLGPSTEQDTGSGMSDAVNHPTHYTSHPSGIECIQITRHMGFNLGNAVKYIWRADLKGSSIQDLEKAAWYIRDEIERRQTT